MSTFSLKELYTTLLGKSGYSGITLSSASLKQLSSMAAGMYAVRTTTLPADAGADYNAGYTNCSVHTVSNPTKDSLKEYDDSYVTHMASGYAARQTTILCYCESRTPAATCTCDIQTNTCDCVSRTADTCECNNWDYCSCLSVYSCNCQLRTYCDCVSREAEPACTCDFEEEPPCLCHGRTASDACAGVVLDCDCNGQQICDCNTRTNEGCICVSRGTVPACTCNARTGPCDCVSRTSVPTCTCDDRCRCNTVDLYTCPANT
jgi:hypothetical protein